MIGLAVCLGIAIVVEVGLVLPWILPEIVHPSGSMAALINRSAARVMAGMIAITATVQVVFLAVLRSQRWMERSLGVTAMLIYSGIALLSLLLYIFLS